MKLDRGFAVVLACFFLSGFAALLYQTAWTRQFSFVFGTSELAVATVLAGYMAGLSLGAAIAGRFAHRIRRPVRVYGLLELGIGVSALALPYAIDVLTALAAVLFSSPEGPLEAGGAALSIFTFATSFVVLLVPTALMGATLPLLSRYAVRSDEELGRRVGSLYAINTLGAIGGTLVAGFVLLPSLGLFLTIGVGVSINALVFLLATLLATRSGPMPMGKGFRDTRSHRGRIDAVLPLVLLSGVTSFGYEVLWTRLLSQVLGGSTYAFSTMLASFLLGITLGSAFASRYSGRRRDAVLGFAASQIAIAGFSLLAFQLLDRFPDWVVRFDAGTYAGLHPSDAVFALALLLPSTFAIGATFPFAIRISARGALDAAPATARVYAWNTVGAIVGAIGAGFFLIPALGFAASAGLLVCLNLVLAAIASIAFVPRVRVVFAATAGFLVLLWLWPPQTPWNLLRFRPMTRQVMPGEIVYYEVGRSATVMVVHSDGAYYVSSNGLPEAGIRPAYDFAQMTNRWMGAFPTLARPEARELLVIGLGGGVIVEEVPASIEAIDVVEIEPAVVEANRVLADRRYIDPLSDPRIRVIENDARAALMLTSKRYDGIVSQPSHPWTAGASHLYTKEFFELARDHLVPGGVFVQWIGLRFVDEGLLRTLVATLLDVFPYVRAYSPPPYASVVFVASDEPLDVEMTVSRAIETSPDIFRRMGIRVPEDVFISLELDEQGAREFARGGSISTDDANILQTRSPRILDRSIKFLRGKTVFTPHDPSARLVPAMDPLYLAYRFMKLRPKHPRLRRLADASGDGEEARLVKLYLNRGYGRGARLRAYEEISSQGASGYRASELIALQLLPGLKSGGSEEAWERAAALPDPARAVTEGWRQIDDPDALSQLEPRLALVGPTDLLYGDAIHLRARWRLATGDPKQRGEAETLLDGILASRDRTFEDFILRGQLAASSGDMPTALLSFDHAARRARVGKELRIRRLRQVERNLLDLSVNGDDRNYRDEIVSRISRRLGRRPGTPTEEEKASR